jgi:acetylornithine deacetylase/succinyl-diaminopimelate desuccinylase-like protein
MDHPAVKAAAAALSVTFGREPVYVREGGSIPVCENLESILGLPVVLLGFTPPNDNAHAPNEWMDLNNYESAIRTVVTYWDALVSLRG